MSTSQRVSIVFFIASVLLVAFTVTYRASENNKKDIVESVVTSLTKTNRFEYKTIDLPLGFGRNAALITDKQTGKQFLAIAETGIVDLQVTEQK